MEIISLQDAVSKIKDGDTLASSGFVGSAVPEYLLEGVEQAFLNSGHPQNLTAVWDSTVGVGKGCGVDHLAHKGLLSRIIASHINLHPTIQTMIDTNEIKAHILPYGCMSQLYREAGSGRPGLMSKIGLHTFVDPRLEGGKGNSITTEDLVEVVEFRGKEYLFYKSFPLNVAFIRGTSIDKRGNLSCEKEAVVDDIFAIAQAVRKQGGTVIAQVERVVEAGTLDPRKVSVPGFLVDYAVVAPPEKHLQVVMQKDFDSGLAHEHRVELKSIKALPLDDRKIIARRGVLELKNNAVVNLGIGMPEGVSSVAAEEGFVDKLIMSVECGQVGGMPAGGAAFGGCYNPDFVVDSVRQFDWYDSGALDVAFLGAAQVDAQGNANVSKFGRTVGPGGFINIAHTAKKVCFCGTLTAGGLELAVMDGRLIIKNEGKTKKFIPKVEQVTFSGKFALQEGQEVFYITERAVFHLTSEGVTLIELAPGIDLQTQVLDQIEFAVKVSPDLRLMDSRIFQAEKMGLTM